MATEREDLSDGGPKFLVRVFLMGFGFASLRLLVLSAVMTVPIMPLRSTIHLILAPTKSDGLGRKIFQQWAGLGWSGLGLMVVEGGG